MNIQITDSEMMGDIECGSDVWEVVEDGEWTQNHKHQYKESVVKHIPTGKFYQYRVSRSGSPFKRIISIHQEIDTLNEELKDIKTVVEEELPEVSYSDLNKIGKLTVTQKLGETVTKLNSFLELEEAVSK